MQLKYISITGADDAVDADELLGLSREFPAAEWALLLMPSRAGQARFPTLDWIRDFAQKAAGLNTAMHLCGDALLGFIDGAPGIFGAMEGFRRIQLNLKFGEVEGAYDPAALLRRVSENTQWQFIIQYAADKQGLLPLLKDIPNHAVLFDESAGRGVMPDSWDTPLPGHFCGYAGGLRPDNIAAQLDIIARVAAGHETWIDMETGVRTDDVFDLAKVRKVLEIASPYAQRH